VVGPDRRPLVEQPGDVLAGELHAGDVVRVHGDIIAEIEIA
jgi:hypothetical protein